MINVLFTDTHFGIKQNSITWLNSQLDFIKNELIPYCKSQKNVRLIHLGDVFDSRSTISTYVASKVIEVFKELRNNVDEFIIIGGNHDYYSPNSDTVNTIDLILSNLDITIVTKDYLILDDDMFIPWYTWVEHMNGNIDIQKIINKNRVNRVYTHADIVYNYHKLIGVDVFSGHNHIPYINKDKRTYNLGSCYSLDFADSNSSRGFYVIKNDNISFIANKSSICFWRLYNDQILDYKAKNIKQNDYIELYISQLNMAESQYSSVINDITKKLKNVWIIPQVEKIEGACDEDKFEKYDIESISREMIPDDLKQKFEIIIQNLNN